MAKNYEAPIPQKPTRRLWLRRFTSLVESQLRSSPSVQPRQAGAAAAVQLRAEWSERYPDVPMPANWIAL
jgi:hypothetical protein